jgi:trehalose 2-sulfotransferase
MIELAPDTPLSPVDKSTLIIAMTARSGSTNLCSVLARLGRFGDPQEYFNPRGPMPHYARALGAATASDYLARLAQRAEIFCFKIAGGDWRPFAARAREVFPRACYVYLDRLDVDAQAISLYRAMASQHWHARANDKGPAPEPPPFDADAIETCRRQLLEENRIWSDFFAEAEIAPMRVSYEQMSADMPKTMQLICREVGVTVPEERVPAGAYKILRDELTDAWAERLRALRSGAAS